MADSTALSQKRCEPCEGKVGPLPAGKAKDLMAQIPKWTIVAEGQRIRREWRREDFVEALDFFRKVGEIAEAEGHHPDLHLTQYRTVAIELWTHAANGLTENDFILAAKIDEIA